MPATIRDVKEKTGLSLATISKYLNGGNVLPENRILIENAIKELNYEVNEIARGLVKNKTKTIGVMVFNISNFFTGNILHFLGQELRKKGYGMMICDSCNDEAIEAENVRFLLNRKVDGLIVLPVSMNSKFLEPAKKAGVPVVLLDRAFQDKAIDCVCIDNRVAAYRAVEILLQNNHKKIAFLGSNVEDTGIERLKGYREAMEHAGVPVRQEYVKLGSFTVKEGYESMKQILHMEDRPTAVFLSNYEMVLGGVMAINESNITWPDDISIFGFDDLLVSSVVRPKLWLVKQPMELLCVNAVKMIIERIGKNGEGPVKLSYGAQIIEGTSIRKLE